MESTHLLRTELAGRPPVTVLVVTRPGDDADEAIRQADELARQRAARLVVAHVLPEPLTVSPIFPERRSAQLELRQRWTRAAGWAARTAVRRLVRRDRRGVQIEVAFGAFRDELARLAAAHRPELVVVGAFVREIASLCRGPDGPAVLVARRHRRSRRILAATDFSDLGTPALRTAAALARPDGTPLVFLHSIPRGGALAGPLALGPSVGGTYVPRPGLLRVGARARARQRLEAYARSFGATASPLVGEDSPGNDILRAASELDIDLIVMGTHGRKGLRRLLAPSVAERVAKRALCSVLIVGLAEPICPPTIAG